MVGMAHAQPHGEGHPSIGPPLQHWRRARNLSQLALAHQANVSPRHVCFLETGRAKPSRDMVLPVTFRHGERAFNFFSAVTVLGTPQDITLQELRIECFFPLDETTAAFARSLEGSRTSTAAKHPDQETASPAG
jgi:transcriptional regulator with XRE-family HTH domain